MDQARSRVSEALSELQRRGVSGPAANWVVRALHPPADHLPPVHVPDDSFRPGVAITYRPSHTVSAPPGLADGESWDLCVVTLPGDVNAAYFLAGPSGTDFSVDTGDGPGRMLGVLTNVSSTLTGTASAVTTGGNVQLYSTYGPSTGIYAFRHTFCSITAYMTASSLYDGGTVTAAQLTAPLLEGNGVLRQAASPTYFPIASLRSFEVPLTETEMLAMVPGTRVAPSKEGVYMPLRLHGPTQPFARRSATMSSIYTSVGLNPHFVVGVDKQDVSPTVPETAGSVASLLAYRDEGGVGWPKWFSALTMYGASGLTPCISSSQDTGFDSVNSSVMIFRGLHPLATITLKMYVGLECIPLPSSPLRSMVAVPPPPSPAALDIYYRIVQSMPPVYPSRDNGLGLLVPKLLSALRFLLPIVAPHVVAAAKDVVGAVVSGTTAKKRPKPKVKAKP